MRASEGHGEEGLGRGGPARALPRMDTLCVALASALAFLALSAPGASAQSQFCPPGSALGQCDGARGLGVDLKAEDERLYVADGGNGRVNVFEPLETPLFDFAAPSPRDVAVDNDPLSPAHRSVWTMSGFTLRKFDKEGSALEECGEGGAGEEQFRRENDPVAVGPGGVVYVGDGVHLGERVFDSRLVKFDHECEFVEALSVPVPRQVTGVAVDSAGFVYLAMLSAGLCKFEQSGSELVELYCLDPGNREVIRVALDEDELVHTVQTSRREAPGSFRVITTYEGAGSRLRRFGYGLIDSLPIGLAPVPPVPGAGEFDAYVSFLNDPENQVHVIPEPPPGPIVPASTLEADPGNAAAELIAEINPEGKQTDYTFSYLTAAEWEANGESFEGPNQPERAEGTLGAEDFDLHTAHALAGCPDPLTEATEGKCLHAETEYRFEIEAENEDGPGEAEAEGAFTTGPPIEHLDTYAVGVGTESAGLRVRANPLGIPATARFEYLDEGAYEANIEAAEAEGKTREEAEEEGLGFAGAARTAELDLGAGEEPASGGASLSPLRPGTTYRYRALLDNPLIEPVVGPERSFATFSLPAPPNEDCDNERFRTGPSALLPDCRAYELVSPLAKGSADVVVRNEASSELPAVLEQSSSEGSKLAYGSYRSFGGAESSPLTSQFIAERLPGEEWMSHPISPPREGRLVLPAIATLDTELKALSPDLCEAWFRTVTDPPLAAGGVAGFANVYRRADELCGGPAWEPLTTVAPEGAEQVDYSLLEPQGHSADGSTAIYVAPDDLPGTGAPPLPEGLASSRLQLYLKREGGPTRFVCVLPDASPSAGPCSAGTPDANPVHRRSNLKGAISSDGGRVVWTAYSGAPGPGSIYLRSNPAEPESKHRHGTASGTGNLAAAASCTGNTFQFAKTVSAVSCAEGEFVPGQAISGPTIAAGTTVESVTDSSLKLSKAASANGTGVALTGEASATVTGAVAATGPFAAGPFAAGQQISAAGGGLPAATTILAVAEEAPGVFELTLSAQATRAGAGVALSATSPCEEPAKACTVAVSAQAEGLSGAEGARYWAAAADGSRVLFTTGGDLYRFDLASEETTLIAGEVSGLLGASEDAERVYLVSREALDAGATAGQPNLYLHHEGAFRFIATLVQADLSPTARHATITPRPSSRLTRVTPDGRHAAFSTLASPLGHDNAEATSGKPVAQAFLYDADADELVCASCNPTGARPVAPDLDKGSAEYRAGGLVVPWQNSLYASRVLSEDGNRLYFESSDKLVPRDSNRRRDVYQWEAEGVGGCDASDTSHSAQSGGCVELVTSGEGTRDAEIADASPDGSDVFFATLASLVPHDFGLVDIYDAREGGDLPVPPAPEPPCEGDACQEPAEAPEPQTPASAAFAGPGNLPAPLPDCSASARKAKRLARGARRARRAAKRTGPPRRAQRMRKAARRRANAARRHSRQAKRCRRARARQAGSVR